MFDLGIKWRQASRGDARPLADVQKREENMNRMHPDLQKRTQDMRAAGWRTLEERVADLEARVTAVEKK